MIAPLNWSRLVLGTRTQPNLVNADVVQLSNILDVTREASRLH